MRTLVSLTIKSSFGLKDSQIYDAEISDTFVNTAKELGVYDVIYSQSKEIKAGEIVNILEQALSNLNKSPEYFSTFNSCNSLNLVSAFKVFIKSYLEACKEYPDAVIGISKRAFV